MCCGEMGHDMGPFIKPTAVGTSIQGKQSLIHESNSILGTPEYPLPELEQRGRGSHQPPSASWLTGSTPVDLERC